SLMPIIRYPVGDRAMWVEPKGTPDRKFLLMGRSDEAAKVGLVKVYTEDVREILTGMKNELGPVSFQLIVVHHDRLDGLIVRVAAPERKPAPAMNDLLVRKIHQARPLYEEFVRDAKVHPIRVGRVEPRAL